MHSESHHDELAQKSIRFLASILDAILVAAILLPIHYMTGFLQKAIDQQITPHDFLAMSSIGVCVFLMLNGYLLVTRGQTVGKYAADIQVVDVNTGRLLPFLRIYVFRNLWALPLSLMAVLNHGTELELIANITILIDALFIFVGHQQRCLHDHFANSKVVLYRSGRLHVA